MSRLRCALDVADSVGATWKRMPSITECQTPCPNVSEPALPRAGEISSSLRFFCEFLFRLAGETVRLMTTSSPEVGEALAEALKKGEEAGEVRKMR